MDDSALKVLLYSEMKGLSDRFIDSDYDNAIDDAERETWSLPVTTNFRIFWLKRRAKRHLLSYLQNEYIDKIQHGETKFQQRFDHLVAVLKSEDDAFTAVQDERPDEFANVSATHLFGTYIKTGFQYDSVGNDLTYEESNEPEFSPSDED